jgi:ankyrin repeat protein
MAVLGILGACGGGPPTALTHAAGEGETQQVEALLAQGADPDEIDGAGGTALMAAARAGRVEVMRVLIKGGADVNRRDRRSTRWTPLVHAIHKRQAAAARLLLDSGAEADAAMDGGATPLMFAAAYGDTAIVEELLSRGADPHRQALDGVTALANAAGGGAIFDITDGPRLGSCHLDTVRALLRHSPDLRLPANLWSRAARFFGRSKDCQEVFALLQAWPPSGVGGSRPDEGEGEGGDRQLPARHPQAAREAAEPRDGAERH